MSSLTAYEAVRNHLEANWTDTPLVFENEEWPLPRNTNTFVFVEIFGDSYEQISIGADPQTTNQWREYGQVLVHVLVPGGEGTRKAREHAKTIVDLFRGRDIGGLRFRDASIGAGEPGDRDGNYFRMTASLEWERDE